MRRIAALTLALTSAPIILATTGSASAAPPPIPIIGDGHKDRICLVWEGTQAVHADGQPAEGDYCVTY
ncbi:MAG: hypothetical protein QOK42_658 [Frankiaceae bacterium]|jgi:hypothetical protein|nr:hypothetical protein [Frankiaceae bacterium]MDX6225138.1 hypothetical protein [Frankiales bacterium]MDX6272802.1 hypothetical protein [Frankiales bacterium]